MNIDIEKGNRAADTAGNSLLSAQPVAEAAEGISDRGTTNGIGEDVGQDCPSRTSPCKQQHLDGTVVLYPIPPKSHAPALGASPSAAVAASDLSFSTRRVSCTPEAYDSDTHSIRNHKELPPGPPTKFAPSTQGRVGVELTDGAVKMVQTSIDSGYGKVMYQRWQNAINGVLGGAFIALGFFLACVVAGGCPGLAADLPGLRKLLLGITFPFGLCMIILTGTELVTSSFSTVGAAWFAGALRGQNLRAATNIALIYVTNFLGALLVAGLAHSSMVLSEDPYRSYVVSVAEHKVHQPAYTAIIKGIVCNWLVSLAVFLSVAAQDVPGKFLGIWPPICAFVTLGMDHCVANMWVLPLGMMLGADYSVGDMFVHNLIPVTFGNIIGSQLCSMVFNVRFRRTVFDLRAKD